MSATRKPLGEFELIARYFRRSMPLHYSIEGIGDDCALLRPSPGEALAISTDTLVAGHHFFEDVSAAALGHKALAVSLSDLAATGACPMAFVLALTLPSVADDWLTDFARGLFTLADISKCELIGGDTTHGPLSITITIFGSTPEKQALLRRGACVGDDIYISHSTGTGLGDARLALHLLQMQRQQLHTGALGKLTATQCTDLLQTCRQRLELPMPRIALGLALRGIANACIDVSDGLQGDLRHILDASGVGATLWAQTPDGGGILAATSPALRSLGAGTALKYALAGGDDYELLFTAATQQRTQIQRIAAQTGLLLTRIGCIDSQTGLRLQQIDGHFLPLYERGFDHFIENQNASSN